MLVHRRGTRLKTMKRLEDHKKEMDRLISQGVERDLASKMAFEMVMKKKYSANK